MSRQRMVVLGRLVDEAVERCQLRLAGRRVVTEAATGAYAATALLAARAGADVTALARGTHHGSVPEVHRWLLDTAELLGVAERIDVVEDLTCTHLSSADIVTNSGHLRPLDDRLIRSLQPTAVVPLMMEAWEVGAGRPDVDLAALRRWGIAHAGTNERHPAVGVFEYLGLMAVKLLLDSGVPVVGTHLLLLCDNPFGPYLERTLTACGAQLTVASSPASAVRTARPVDAVVVSLTPATGPRLGARELECLAEVAPGAVLAQFFGDIDRVAATARGFTCWPDPAPPHGHMGVLPSAIGDEPIVRLQAGGLKVGEVLLKAEAARTPFESGFLDVL